MDGKCPNITETGIWVSLIYSIILCQGLNWIKINQLLLVCLHAWYWKCTLLHWQENYHDSNQPISEGSPLISNRCNACWEADVMNMPALMINSLQWEPGMKKVPGLMRLILGSDDIWCLLKLMGGPCTSKASKTSCCVLNRSDPDYRSFWPLDEASCWPTCETNMIQ